MMRISLFAMFAVGIIVLPAESFAHCQIPCGIYADQAEFDRISQDIDTVEKSMKQIVELSASAEKNYNQIVRWVSNKDTHAQRIQQSALDYFLAQRIKSGTDKYNEKLAALHSLIVHAMKAKQTTDLQHIENLRATLKDFHALYFGEEKEHAESHSVHKH